MGEYVDNLPDHLNNDHDLSRIQEDLGLPDAAAWFKQRNPDGLSAVECRRTLPKQYFRDLEDEVIKQEWNERLETLVDALYTFARRARVWHRHITGYWEHWRRMDAFRPQYPNGMDEWLCGPSVNRTSHYFASPDPANTPPSIDASAAPSGRYAGERVMVLLNISKGIYVRSDALAVKGNDPVWGLGRAILSRICWLSDPSCHTAWGDEKTKGVWAGDAFDVGTLEAWLKKGEGWKDVSDEVREEMLAIMKSSFSDLHWCSEWMW